MDDISLRSFKQSEQTALQHVVVKCRFQRSCKRITFVSTALSFGLLKHKIDQIFALSNFHYNIKYRDDENEVTDISCDNDLWEAVEYFSEGSDESSATSSVVSFTSEGSPKIILPVFLDIEYDGPSLSETMSYRSQIESFRFGSQSSLPAFPKSDVESQSGFESVTGRYGRRFIESPHFNGPNISLLCGILATLQAPILFSLVDMQHPESVSMRLIHTLFTWSIILHLFGAIIAVVSKLRINSHHRSLLPTPYDNPSANPYRQFWRTVCERAGAAARVSAQFFTIIGTICLLSAVLSLMWVTHPLTLHTISMRSILMLTVWVFFACLGYHIFDPSS